MRAKNPNKYQHELAAIKGFFFNGLKYGSDKAPFSPSIEKGRLQI